jgi:hypothetical protein
MTPDIDNIKIQDSVVEELRKFLEAQTASMIHSENQIAKAHMLKSRS